MRAMKKRVILLTSPSEKRFGHLMLSYCDQRSSWAVTRVCLLVGLLSFWLLLAFNIERTDMSLFVPHVRIDNDVSNTSVRQEGFLVDTEGCRIPDLDPFDISVRKFISYHEVLECARTYGPALLESNLTAVYIVESAFAHYNVTDSQLLHCCYTPFYRKKDSQVLFSKECITFINSTTVRDEFVRTECFFNNNSIYVDYHAFTPLREDNKPLYKSGSDSGLSVLVIGVDAVSRLNLYRQMPETVKFLKSQLNAVEMLGFNKVADNTFPNLVPVLVGLSEQELVESCWPSTKEVFDNCNFIWNDFRLAEYKTAFGEDAPWMGIFSYLKRGFSKQPTDYYWRTFSKKSEDEIGFDKRYNAKLCTGPRKTLENLLSYASKFAVTMKNFLSFGFFWGASLSHDSLNLPMFGDDDHKTFLENLYLQGVFNKTILIFMSDHGIRWGGIRQTYQGYLEERLPFLFIAYPNWFPKIYTTAVYNLKKNSVRLTTPFDVHELLLDLVNVTRIEKDNLRVRSGELIHANALPRGISLFLPIPGKRTCFSAGIDDHWCTCHQSQVISTNSSSIQKTALYLVGHINHLLKNYSQCAELKLNNILSAREEKSTSHNNFTSSDAGIRDFSLTVQTAPGNALFEATIRFNGNSGEHSVVGTISRINQYGDQSKCVPQYKLRLYCYCSENLAKNILDIFR